MFDLNYLLFGTYSISLNKRTNVRNCDRTPTGSRRFPESWQKVLVRRFEKISFSCGLPQRSTQMRRSVVKIQYPVLHFSEDARARRKTCNLRYDF